MAQPMTSSVLANGASPSPAPAPTPPDIIQPSAAEPANSSILPVKRKREAGDDANGDADTKMEGDDSPPELKDPRRLVQDFYHVLQSHDTSPSILNRPIRIIKSEDEPEAKRQKSIDGPDTVTIASKVAHDQYALLDDLIIDLSAVITDQIADLKSSDGDDRAAGKGKPSIDAILRLKKAALELARREMNYPRSASDPLQSLSIPEIVDGNVDPGVSVLSVRGRGLGVRHLFSSLPNSMLAPSPTQTDTDSSLSGSKLPPNISKVRVLPGRQLQRSATFGETYLASGPVPPLLIPRYVKGAGKGNVIGFHHSDPFGRAKQRSNSYYDHKMPVGYYLDYSRASASPPSKTAKQRERAQSLAGHKPSSSELEMAELDALFRGAFSSFAPCKDDAGAMVPASLAGRIHWQKKGQTVYNRMIAAELEDESEQNLWKHRESNHQQLPELDEELIKKTIDDMDPEERWDDSMIDPSLRPIVDEKQSSEDKDVDELLNEVSDMIETLWSYQHLRNSEMPSWYHKHSSDSFNRDMLTNSGGPKPTMPEMEVYQALKAQLKFVVNMLPPFAVAKLDGDKINELLVTTKMEVYTEQSAGVLQDEGATGAQAATRTRQQHQTQHQHQHQHQQNALPSPSRQQTHHRAPAASPAYHVNQYGTPAGRQPMPQQQQPQRPGYYGTSTMQQQQPHQQHQQPVSAHRMPQSGTPQQMPHQNHRTPQPHAASGTPQAYRPANGYAQQFAPHLAKSQTPFGHQSAPQYGMAGSPQHQGQQQHQHQQQQQHPTAHVAHTGNNNNSSMMDRGSPAAARYKTAYGQSYQHPQQAAPGRVSGYPNYNNGTANIQPRTISPQLPGGQYGTPQQYGQQHGQQHGQSSPVPQQQHLQQQHRQYAPSPHQGGNPSTPMNRQQYMNGNQQPQYNSAGQAGQGYLATAAGQDQQRLQEHQAAARARAAAQQNNAAYASQAGQAGVSGLAGIGLTGGFNAVEYAAHRARMSGGVGPKSQSPANSNHSPRPAPNGTPNIPRKETPVPVPVIPPVQQQYQGQQQQQQQQQTQTQQQQVGQRQQTN